MKGWFKRGPSETDQLVRLLREQQASNERIINNVTNVVNEQAKATAAMAVSFSDYLSLFRVTAPPVDRRTTDEAESVKELKKKGYPVDGTVEEQLRFLFRDE